MVTWVTYRYCWTFEEFQLPRQTFFKSTHVHDNLSHLKLVLVKTRYYNIYLPMERFCNVYFIKCSKKSNWKSRENGLERHVFTLYIGGLLIHVWMTNLPNHFTDGLLLLVRSSQDVKLYPIYQSSTSAPHHPPTNHCLAYYASYVTTLIIRVHLQFCPLRTIHPVKYK